MGAGQSSLPSGFRYNVPAPDSQANETETCIYRSYYFPDRTIANEANKSLGNAFELFMDSVRNRSQNRMIGRRERQPDGSISASYKWYTYEEVYLLALRCGTSLVRNQLVRTQLFTKEKYPGAKELRTVGIFGKNSYEWFVTEQACNAYGYTLCPLYDTFGKNYIIDILKISRLNVIFCDYDCWEVMAQCIISMADDSEAGISAAIVNHVILINKLPSVDPATYDKMKIEAEATASKYGCQVYSWEDFLAKPDDHLYDPEPAPASAVHTLCFTSGATGAPKGVIISHSNVIATVTAATQGPIRDGAVLDVKATDIFISYLPLAHVLERCVCNVVIYRGAAIGVFSGNLSTLLDDIKALRPTVFVSVPRLFNRINDKISGSLQSKGYPTQILFSQALRTKVLKRRSSSITTHKLWDGVLFSKIRDLLGGDVRAMVSGGAPLDPLVCERMTAYVSAPLMQGYGLTESFGPCFLVHEKDGNAGCVGGVWPAVEFKLVSVPDLDYLVTDKPFPRGELWLRGPGIAKGYFMVTDEHEGAFDKDGWFHTGDIAILEDPRSSLRIVDRKKAIFKLSQGEYICPEKIEAAICQSPLISQAFVFGYSIKSCIIGLLVPDEEAAQIWAAKNQVEFTSVANLCQDVKFIKAVSKELEKISDRSKFRGFERLKAFKLLSEPFTGENDMLSPTSKIKRLNIFKAYVQEIDELYKEAEAGQQPADGAL